MLQLSKSRRVWYVIDAKNKTLGRLASTVARYLIGKHKVEYVPYIDSGDYVIVINSKEVYISGNKYNDKVYYHHTGYIGGIKKMTFKEMINRFPNRVIETAIKGMLPKGILGNMMYRRLRVYSGNTNRHTAQMPRLLQY